MDNNGQLNLKSKVDSKRNTKNSLIHVYLKTTEVTQLSSNDEIIVPFKETKCGGKRAAMFTNHKRFA